MKISLFLPFVNEIHGLKAVLPRIKPGWVDEFIFIDGHSTDGSREFIESLGYKVILQERPGLLAAWWQGFDACTGDIIIPFSPDNNSVPEDIPRLLEKVREGNDVVIASRYLGGSRSKDDGVASHLANRFFTALVNGLYGGHFTDALTMFKAFRRDLLANLRLDEHRGDHFEILFACRIAKNKNLRYAEIASEEPPRLDGTGSRAHPGPLGKYKSALLFLGIVLRERVNGLKWKGPLTNR